MSTIFTKIIQGEIPCYKIYEDDLTFAFLDINPEAPGHTLVVPKIEVEKLYDLDDRYYNAVMATVKKLAKHYENVLGKRMQLKVVGIDVPHAHVHILPAPEKPAEPEDSEAPKTPADLKEPENSETANSPEGPAVTAKPSEADFLALQSKLKLN